MIAPPEQFLGSRILLCDESAIFEIYYNVIAIRMVV
jgi:hypothetical protein